MKPITRTIILFSLAGGLASLPLLLRAKTPETKPRPVEQIAAQPKPQPKPDTVQPTRKIQVAILLDTSSSMDGLIGQAKSQLWKIVNQLAAAKRNGERPVLEIALYEYGKSTLEASGGYVRMILPLTGDLDRVSEELFALTTNGGEEYAGKVIQVATDGLTWTKDLADLRLMFIAGNEPFTQGDVDYRDAIRAASKKGITVNTIFCGNRSEGIATGWQAGALLADGRFLAIDQDMSIAHITAPQDAEIARLGGEINDTYIPFGAYGASSYARQRAQDANAEAHAGSMMQRSVSKSSAAYHNASWDLVDAHKDGAVDLSKMKEEEMPENMRKMNAEERAAYVKAQADKRAKIQRRIAELNVERTKFVEAETVKHNSTAAQSLDAALIAAVRDQASKNGYQFE